MFVAVACAVLIAATSISADLVPETARSEVEKEKIDVQTSTLDPSQSSTPEFLQDPVAGWDKFIAKHSSDIREINKEERDLLHRISVARVEKEGIEAFRSISESLGDPEVRIWVLDNLFEKIAQSDPELAFDAAVELQRDAGRTFLRQVAMEWSLSDPKAVLESMATADWDELELGQMQKAVVRDWANREPASLLALSKQIPLKLQSYGRLQALLSWATQEPESAAVHIGEIQDRVNKRTLARNIALNWLEKDVTEAIEWVQSSQEIEEFRREVLVEVLNELAASSPTTAFEIALEQPVEDFHVGLEVSVIRKLVVNDLDLALKLLPKVREGTSKFAAISSVGTAFADSGNIDKALELANELPVASRGMYLSNAVAMWGIANPKTVFEEISKLPTPELRSRAAMMALTGNSRKEVLSKDQAEVLKTYLSEGSPEVFVPLQHDVPPSE